MINVRTSNQRETAAARKPKAEPDTASRHVRLRTEGRSKQEPELIVRPAESTGEKRIDVRDRTIRDK